MFKRVWMPVTGQSLQVRAETCNKNDSYAVATPYNDTILSPRARSRCRNCPCIQRLKHVNYLSCLAEIRGNFTYLSEGVLKNKSRVLPRKKSRVVLCKYWCCGESSSLHVRTCIHVLHVVSRYLIYGRGN